MFEQITDIFTDQWVFFTYLLSLSITTLIAMTHVGASSKGELVNSINSADRIDHFPLQSFTILRDHIDSQLFTDDLR